MIITSLMRSSMHYLASVLAGVFDWATRSKFRSRALIWTSVKLILSLQKVRARPGANQAKAASRQAARKPVKNAEAGKNARMFPVRTRRESAANTMQAANGKRKD